MSSHLLENLSSEKSFLQLLFPFPEIPRCEGLQKQHFQSVLYGGSLLFALLHEEGFIGVVDQII